MPEITTLGLQIAQAVAPFEDDVQWYADEPLSALRVVRVAATNRLRYARPPELEALAPLGITTAACSTGQIVQLATRNTVQDSSWHWTVGVPVLLGANGVLVQIQPAELSVMLVIGVAIATDTIVIRIGAPIDLAPGG
jgi:hypothetical protein